MTDDRRRRRFELTCLATHTLMLRDAYFDLQCCPPHPGPAPQGGKDRLVSVSLEARYTYGLHADQPAVGIGNRISA